MSARAVRKDGGEPLLVVTDDDIPGTFTFIRALPEQGPLRGLRAGRRRSEPGRHSEHGERRPG